MKMNSILAIITSLVMLTGACNENQLNDGDQQNDYLKLTLQPDNEKQIIHNFGASDAWSCQFVGKNWPLEKRQHIADLLFSTAMDESGQPRGIGLSAWRFNIGGGSAEQGSESNIGDPWRRAECFLNADGTYDWQAQAGQRWFLRAAQERGVDQFIGFVNSPPVSLTENGKAYSSGGNSANLPESNYSQYAGFLAQVVQGIQEKDQVKLDYISPFNEPQWDWDDSGQEGSPWTNSEIHDVCEAIDQAFREQGVSAQLEIPETAQNKYLYSYDNKPERGNQIEEFFNPSSENYLGDLDHIAPKMAGHSYFSTYNLQNLIDTRKSINDKIQQVDPGLEYWMSEYCILENNEEIQGNGRDLGMDPALYIARVIHADLTVAHASAWQWWLGVSPYDYKDGLVYIDKDTQDGQVYESKMLWALGHYSRFIRPGMQRIGVQRSDQRVISQSIGGTLVSAYKSRDKEKYVMVIVNQRDLEIPVKIGTENIPQQSEMKWYLTTSQKEQDMRFVGTEDFGQIIQVPGRSLVTLVIE